MNMVNDYTLRAYREGILLLENEISSLKAERDALKARIDGGIRVYAYQDKEDIHQRFYAHTNMNSNATLILDEGVEL